MKAHNAMNFGRIAGKTILLAKGNDLPHKPIVQKCVAQTDLIMLAKRAYAIVGGAHHGRQVARHSSVVEASVGVARLDPTGACIGDQATDLEYGSQLD